MDSKNEFRSTVDQFAKILQFLSTGVTPLLGATLVGDVELVRKLLEAGENPNVGEPPKHGRALEVAARTGNGALCRLLAESGAEVREKEMLAALNVCSLEATKALLPFYVQTCGVGHGGTEVLYSALSSGSAAIAAAVLDAPLGYEGKINVECAGKTYPPFGAVVARNSPSVLRLLIERGADGRGCVVTGGVRVSYLHLACEKAGSEVVRLLIDAGADVNAEADGDAPIHKVYTNLVGPDEYKRQEDVLQVLIDHGADITAKNKHGRTIMQIVSRIDSLRQIIVSAKTANSVEASVTSSVATSFSGHRKASAVSPL
jgi:hypothetical protein